MKIKKDIQDSFYQYIQDRYTCKVSDELFWKKYIIAEKFEVGNFFRMKIEDGLEISKLTIPRKMEMDFDNRGFDDNVLELGYCYRGNIRISSLPDDHEYIIKEGNIFGYKMLNDIDHFKFKYTECKTISIHMNFNAIKNAMNPIGEERLILDWEKNLNNIFKGNILIVEEASYNLEKIAKQIDSISPENMMGYMNLKLKTIEFLTTLIEEKNNKNALQGLKEEIVRAKEIIDNNIENVPSVKELASDLNISVYKLQKWFKDTTGNTVYEYIKKVRIEKAKYLLKNTNMSILEIANEIGYENPSKFANVFKRYNNMTPLKYRKIQE